MKYWAYSHVIIPEEHAIEEPHNSIDGQREGQEKGHVLHAPRPYDFALHEFNIRTLIN